MHRALTPLAAAAALVSACTAPVPAPDGARPIRGATTMGVGARVASYARWDEACGQAGLPTAEVTTGPMHGTLTVRPAAVIAGRRLNGATDCRDKPFQGVEFWYVPAAGFRGTDRMAYQVDAGQGPVRVTATMDVR